MLLLQGSNFSSKSSAGFTLLEVMVVLAIVGALLAMVSFTGDSRQAQDETTRYGEQLRALFNAYRQEAVFQNIDLGVAIDDSGFYLLSFQDINRQEISANKSREELDQLAKNPWQPYSGSLKNSLDLPEPMYLKLSLDGQEVDLTTSGLAKDEGFKPVLLFLSADEYSVFELLIEHEDDERFLVKLQGDGLNAPQLEVQHFEY